MARNLVIVDSCVFIKAFRKDIQAKNDLLKIDGHIAYSTVTHLELLTGARTATKKDAINQIFNAYYGIPINHEISEIAIQLMNEYVSGQRVLAVPDCLIAATSLFTGFPILTYNLKDFVFIKG